MTMKQFITVAAFAAVTVGGLAASPAMAVVIPTVPIGNVGNAADSTPNGPFGSVAYAYNIGSTEVTNAQYAEFLNAVAYDDTNSLYNANMAGSFGGITRSGFIGAFTYATVPGRANNPVNFVSFWDSTRFANWLHNGQPTGPQNNTTTEDGAYTLTPGGISANTITRNAGWQWAVTSENEWHKAAYHQPASQGGDADDYWLYPTSSNSITTAQANYDNFIGGNTTPVGSYAANFYGTFDMGGNLSEWNEAIISGSNRGLRGGSFETISILANELAAYYRGNSDQTFDNWNDFGFRVVQVPGPSAVALLAIGGAFGGMRRRR